MWNSLPNDVVVKLLTLLCQSKVVPQAVSYTSGHQSSTQMVAYDL